jgi:hypothetical protein
MNPRIRRILSLVGYPLFYVVCLIVFCYVSAPWERLKNAIVANFNANAPLHMQVEKLTWAWRFPASWRRGQTHQRRHRPSGAKSPHPNTARIAP